MDIEKHANRIIGVVKIKKFTYSEKLPKKCKKESQYGAKMDSKSISESDANPYRFLNAFLMDFGGQMAPKMEPKATKNREIRSSRTVLDAEAVQDLILNGFWTIFVRILDGFWMILGWFLDAGRFLLLAFMCFHTHVFGCSKVSVVSYKSYHLL